MRWVNVHEARSRLLAEVEAGGRVIIARAGKPVAVLTSYQPPVRKRRLGLFAGQVRIHEDFDELPADMASALGMTL